MSGAIRSSKEEQFLADKSQVILDSLKKSGLKVDGEVYASHSTEMKVVFEHKDFSISTNHTTSMFGIRAIVNGRLGFATTNATDDDALKKAAGEVLEVAKLSPPSEFHQIADVEMASLEHGELYDDKIANMPVKDVFDFAEATVDIARSDERVSIDRAEFSITNSAWSLLNSKGVKNSSRQTNANWYAMGMAKTADEVTSFDWDGGSACSYSQISSGITKAITKFRDSVIESLSPKSGDSYKGLVVLHPDAVMDLIGEHVEFNCNGRAHQDGMSSWKDKLGESVATSNLMVIEDPTNRERFEGWCLFDREGVKTQKHVLIDGGKLNFVAHNCFSANRGKTKPTGNSAGGARGLPAIGFYNMAIGAAKGGVADNELFKMIKSGLVIKRFSGNSDPTSGMFSGIAKNSWWLKNGERVFPVKEVMVAGNSFEMLKNIVAIGHTQHHMMGGGLAPYVIIDGLSVTAGK